MTPRLIVGVTGGIGSGKSAATALFEKYGIEVVDADLIARLVVEPGTEALQQIADHFGATILHADGTLDRAALRAKIFATPSERQWLESLLHPLIREEILARLAASQSDYTVLSSPLLFETGQNALVDKVVLIDTSEAQQIARTTRRDKISTSAVSAIMESQWPREKRRAKADFIILNDGTLEELESAVEQTHQQLLKFVTHQQEDQGLLP